MLKRKTVTITNWAEDINSNTFFFKKKACFKVIALPILRWKTSKINAGWGLDKRRPETDKRSPSLLIRINNQLFAYVWEIYITSLSIKDDGGESKGAIGRRQHGNRSYNYKDTPTTENYKVAISGRQFLSIKLLWVSEQLEKKEIHREMFKYLKYLAA